MPLAVSTPGLDLDAMAECLAEARRTGGLALGLDLGRLRDREEAEALREAAVRELGWAQIGWSLVGTHPVVARALRLDGPVVGPLLREAVLEDGALLALPRGAIGAGAGLTFLIGRSFPFTDAECANAATAATACIACRVDLHLVGRRTAVPITLGTCGASADFGLDLAHVAGPWVEGWGVLDLPSSEASFGIDGHELARGHGRDALGDPLAAVAWLARRLAAAGSGLNAGDLVSVGSCTGLSQVLPGQTLRARFARLGTVSLHLH